MSFSEKDKKVTVTIGLIMFLIVASFFVGTLWQKNQSLHEKFETLEDNINDKIDASNVRMVEEVGGLRSDWDRDRLDKNRRLDNLESKR